MAVNKKKAKAKVKTKTQSKQMVKGKTSAKAKTLKVKAATRAGVNPKRKAKAARSAKKANNGSLKVSLAPKSGTFDRQAFTFVAADFESVLTPLDDRLLILVEGEGDTTAGGIIIPGTSNQRPNRGQVLAKGKGRRNKKGQVRPMDVSVGDSVLFAEYAGTPIQIQGREFLIIREDDVLGIHQR